MTQEAKQTRPKILIVDDDAGLVETYRGLLAALPSQPEVFSASTGARALSMLRADSFRLLVCDLRMPKMDGIQVLSIVRRSFPELRTVVITGVQDEQFRSRAYALGVDMYWLKPNTRQDMEMFLQCIESLLGRDGEGGFRGVQSKGLMDILQMESLSQSSTVLRVTRGSLVGRLWFQSGELVDAETEGARGEAAFQRILGWKSGTFENLPPEPARERTITKPLNALLLETAQAMDEIAAPEHTTSPEEAEQADHRHTVWRLAALTREGADFVVSLDEAAPGNAVGWGTDATQEIGRWMGQVQASCQHLAQRLEAGPWSHLEGKGLSQRIVMLSHEGKAFLVGWPASAEASRLRDQSRKLVASWES
ncbi:MAG TPA: response regulator [Candidatus Acidoferrum sp.]|jgi:DNA-binding NarL/FixJ family response regulator|nr:response regulator [Candidatus Acidoferrum sp.]